MKSLKFSTYIFLGILSSFIFMIIIHMPMEAKPATQSDPLVTLSYVDKRFSDMNEYLEAKFAVLDKTTKSNVVELSQATNNSVNQSVSQSVFEVIKVSPNTMLYLADSTEFIIRSGKALVIASKSGGLIDISAGMDLSGSKQIPNNHLILNPLNDGRGFVVTDEAWVMIRGEYTLVSN